MPIIDIVVPCYNEEECLPLTMPRLLEKLKSLIAAGKIDENSSIVMVDDGSKDKTWEVITSLHEQDPHYRGLKLSHNRGHQYALVAGVEYSAKRADASISIDADLQDDINAIDQMVEEFEKGADIVYGVRSSRETDTFFKRATAQGYYRILQKWAGVEVIYNHADFRLMSKKAMDALLEYKESALFLRGIVPELGFKTAKVTYARKEREAGQTHYSLSKMLSLAWNGVTSFSIKPLREIFRLGLLFMILSVIAMVTFGVLQGVKVLPYDGLPYILGSIFLMGGILLAAMGILGVYVGKVNYEVKKRPRYFIEETLE